MAAVSKSAASAAAATASSAGSQRSSHHHDVTRYSSADYSKVELARAEQLMFLLRSRKMASEQDIVVTASGFLKELFDDRLSDKEKLAIENWLSTQLEVERRGWKGQLQMSLKEIEKERKHVLDYHTALQTLNERIEPRARAVHITREQTGFINTDKDNRVKDMCILENNVVAVIDKLDLLLEDRAETMKVFDVEEDGLRHVPVLLKQRLSYLENQLQEKTELLKTLKLQYESELEILQSALKEKEDLSLEQKEQDAQELAILRALARSQKDVIDSRINIATEHKQTQTETSHSQTAETQTEANTNLRHASIPEESPRSDFSSPRKDCLALNDRLNKAKEDIDHCHKNLRKTNGQTHQLHSNRHTPAAASSSLSNHQPVYLNGGGVTGATPAPINGVQQQLKTDYELVQAQRQAQLRKLQFANRRWPTEGFIMGIKIGEDGRMVDFDTAKSIGEKSLPLGMANCLRCHRSYRVKDNHKTACRFHPKPKQQIEKYGATGKLLRVAHLWECCLQHPDATGCTTGEHI